jgi:malic enzyme
MADDTSSTASTGIIAILVIFVILVVGALFVLVAGGLAATRGSMSTSERLRNNAFHRSFTMRDDSQATTSIWMATTNTPSQSRLKENIRTDICIVGAGIAGLTTAYLLGREGRSVVVLDDGLIGGGMTGRTTAHLTNAYDDRYVEIENFTALRRLN